MKNYRIIKDGRTLKAILKNIDGVSYHPKYKYLEYKKDNNNLYNYFDFKNIKYKNKKIDYIFIDGCFNPFIIEEVEQ